MRFYKRIGYHDFEGIATDLDERERIVADLGEHQVPDHAHHGLLTAGVNIGEAFNLMYYLEKSCETQMMVLASNQPYSLPSQDVVREVGAHLLGERRACTTATGRR